MERPNIIAFKRLLSGQAVQNQLIGVEEKKKMNISFNKNALLLLGMSVLLGRATILDGLSPFGIAFLLTMLNKDRRYIYLGFGVLIGLISCGAQLSIFKYSLILGCAGIFFYFFRDRIQARVFVLGITSGLLVFSGGLIYLVFKGLYMYDIFMLGFESVVVFVFVYITSYSIPVITHRSNRKVLSNEEIICIAISGAVVISGLTDITIYGYSAKNVFGVLLTLIFAFNGGVSVGAGVGVTIGIITSMSTIGTPTVIGVYAFSGLLAGIFKDLGKLGSGIGMILGNAILTFYINGSSEVILHYNEIIVALIIFMMMPKSVTLSMAKFIGSSASGSQLDRVYGERLKSITYNQLKQYSDAFSELAVTYGNILEKTKIVEYGEVADMVDQVVNKVCNQCGMCRGCWHNNFYQAYNGVVEVIGQLESSGRISPGKVPESLRKRCIRLNELIKATQDVFEIYKIHYNWQKKLFEGRQLVADQFKGVSEIIGTLAQEVNSKVEFKSEIEDALYAAFDREGLSVDRVTVLMKNNDNMEIEIEKRACFDRKQCDFKIRPLVSKIIGREVTLKNNQCNGNGGANECTFKFIEAPKYRVMPGVARIAKDNSAICGDSYSFTELEDGKYMVALSDGMGSGERAAKESRATITLIEQLMEAGFDKDIAIKTINSILMLKSSDEIFATMDLSLMDLYSGKVEFVKIGSTASFIKRADGEVEVIKSSSLPIGILNKVDIESFDKKLNGGDFVIMMSDGILDADKGDIDKERWMVALLKEINSRNPQYIAEELLQAAIEKYGNQMEDDMTVLVSKIWETR